MKKIGILNSEISHLIATLGHTDSIAIADAGLPIPDNVKRIDISLVKGIPSFLETINAVLIEMEVEEFILAEEIKEKNPEIEKEILKILGNKKMKYLPHEEFKQNLRNCKAVIRTGEASPYANIILKAGVIF